MIVIKLLVSLFISVVFVSWLWFILDIVTLEMRKKRDENERNNKN